MRIIVAGGGIGGLAAAAALRRAGAEPLVLERAPELLQVGAGVNISANGMKALRHIGADQHVRETSVRSEGSLWADLSSGQEFLSVALGEQGEAAWGDGFYHVHRADLLDALLAVVPDSDLRLNSPVSRVEQRGEEVVAVLENGEEIVGDGLVGADGLRSVVRSSLFGEQPATPTGYVAWRSLITADGPHGIDRRPFSSAWIGQRRHVIFYPISGGRLLNFVGFVPTDEVAARESWTASGDIAALRASFADSCDEVGRIVDAIDEAFVTAIQFRDPLTTWGQGRLTLLGDAAHPMPPSAAQGAGMALEDAVMLGRAVEYFGDRGVETALREYENRRIPRTSRVFGTAMTNFEAFNQSDPALLRGRNGRFQGLSRLDPTSRSTWGWIYGYDVVAGFDEPPRTVADGAVNPLRRPAARDAFNRWSGALRATDFADAEAGLRAGYDRFMLENSPVPDGVTIKQVNCDGVPALAVMPEGTTTGPVVVHVHGGLFTMGSAKTSAGYAARLAVAVGGWALVVDYRLAPEHEFPLPLDDVRAAYRWVRSNVDIGAPVVMSGTDAGANLALAATLASRDAGEALPDGLFLVSPLGDLSLTSATLLGNQSTDPFVSWDFLTVQVASYIHASDPGQPLLSPARADLAGLPATVIHVARDEVFIGDAEVLAERARAGGVDVRLNVVEDSVPVFTLFESLPETAKAMDDLRYLANVVSPSV